MSAENLLTVKNLRKTFSIPMGFGKHVPLHALRGVDFTLEKGKTLAVVGESGCGKSTLAKCLLGIETPTEGEVLYHGKNLHTLPLSDRVHAIQMIFQDPYGSLNPRKKVWQIISEPLQIQSGASKEECREEARKLMKTVGLRPEFDERYPHMFSGGQRQRIGIARALVLRPQIILCDEPVSALDVSVQAQVLNLLEELKREFHLSLIFISHDLSVVKHVADEVMVMYLGETVEYAKKNELFHHPVHPYTKALLTSAPSLSEMVKREKIFDPVKLSGELPSPLHPPSGCTLHGRCPYAFEKCLSEHPELTARERATKAACHLS